MIKRIEAWFRKLLREEGDGTAKIICAAFVGVDAKHGASVNGIKVDTESRLKQIEDNLEKHLAEIEGRVSDRLEELVTRTLERFDQKAQLIEQSISKELDHWKADEDTRKQDEALRKKK